MDTEGYHRYDNEHDLVVLAIGMEPSVDASKIMKGVAADVSGFIDINATTEAVFGAGCASNALDVNRAVQSATAGALRAIQVINRVSQGGGLRHMADMKDWRLHLQGLRHRRAPRHRAARDDRPERG